MLPSSNSKKTRKKASKEPLNERALIAGLRARAEASTRKRGQVLTGIGDDCAVLRVPRGHELAVTTDLLLEAVHFHQDWHSPESAGHRCLARGLSDLAAMGARPLAAFLSIALPPRLGGQWHTRFMDGLLALAGEANVPLAGGDTAQSPVAPGAAEGLVTADILLLGSLPRGTALLRSGARAGDQIYVTGALGGAAAELLVLARKKTRARLPRQTSPGRPQLFPQPRLAQGLRLRALASACIDLSDGLSTDLAHLCESSGLCAEIEAASLPLHPLAQREADPLPLALHGGEDYELLFTAPPSARVPRSIAGVPVTPIGRMIRRRSGIPVISLVSSDGIPSSLENAGWEHFRSAQQK